MLEPAEAQDAGARGDFVTVVSAVALIVGVIHVVVSVGHAKDYWLFGVLFALVGVLQVAWGVSIYRGASPFALQVGALGNAGVIVVWLASRTVGLPVGPAPWDPESVDVLSALATVDEAYLVVAALVLLPHAPVPRLRRALTARTAERLALALAIASLSALVLLGGHHTP